MTPFWTSLFAHLKECGREATVFILTLAVLFGFLLIALILQANDLDRYVLPVLCGLGLVVLVSDLVSLRRAWKRRCERWRYSPLSSDELRVARSKLVREQDHKSL